MSLLSRNILITLSTYCLICAFVLPGLLNGLPLDELNSNKGLESSDSSFKSLLKADASKQTESANDQGPVLITDADDLDEAAADTDEQRNLASYYLALYLQELINNGQLEESDNEPEASRYAGRYEKRASPRAALIKKESPFEQQRNKDMRRQQAARWDIGFGKRASYKPKAFMDALYGKRSNLFYKQSSPKFAYGRKQQWDIQYGRR